MEHAPQSRWAQYTTAALERLRAQVEAENGGALPGLLADITDELARRAQVAQKGDAP